VANGLIMEYYGGNLDPMWDRIYRRTLRLNDDGTVSPPEEPGVGLDPNYEALAPHRMG
jgi:L-alanine-DL-glutamate epimerase-like enolase superfamily enzyme